MAGWRILPALLLLISCVLGELFQLNKTNFENYVRRTEFLVVSFCVPWYEPCQALVPELESAAEALSSKNIYITEIDCNKEVEICNKYDVNSYPAIRIFHGLERTPERYRGRQKAKQIVSHMIKQNLELISDVDQTNIEDFKDLDSPLLIAYFDQQDAESRALFIQTAESQRQKDILFGWTTDKSLFSTEDMRTPFIVLWNPTDEIPAIYEGAYDIESITKFTREAIASPLLPHFGMQKFAEYAQTGLPLALIFSQTQQERTSLAQELKLIVLKNKDKMNFAVVDAVKLPFLAEPLGLDGVRWPAFVVHDIELDETYLFDQGKDITKEGIEKFLVGVFENVEARQKEGKVMAGGEDHDEL